MTSSSLTRVWCSSKPGRALAGLLAGLGLAATLAACSTTPTDIGVGLPSVDTNSGVYLLDTLTVRASTVLRDSVVTSTSSYLLVGRALDPQLGLLTATSFFTPQLVAPFVPANNAVLDSVVLNLVADNTGYRFGDTTRVQSLVRVYPLDQPLPAIVPLYANPRYTPLAGYYRAIPSQLLNRRDAATGMPLVPRRRASPKLTSIRVPLDMAFGQRLMTAAKAGLLRTQDQLGDLLPGLVIAPDDNDQGAIVRLLVSSDAAGLSIYYHDPADASTPQVRVLRQTSERHAFQVTADRTTAAVRNLPTQALQRVDASLTGQQTVVEGSLGLQTRLEFPYLANVRDLGRNLNITSAELKLEVPPATLSPYLPAPPTLRVYRSNLNNQPTSNILGELSYLVGISNTTGQEQGAYTLSMTNYVQDVLSGAVLNNGILLASASPDLPSRVLLGGPRHPTNRLRLRLYVINTN